MFGRDKNAEYIVTYCDKCCKNLIHGSDGNGNIVREAFEIPEYYGNIVVCRECYDAFYEIPEWVRYLKEVIYHEIDLWHYSKKDSAKIKNICSYYGLKPEIIYQMGKNLILRFYDSDSLFSDCTDIDFVI